MRSPLTNRKAKRSSRIVSLPLWERGDRVSGARVLSYNGALETIFFALFHTAFPIQPPPLRGTSFHRKEGVSTRAPSLGRGCRAQRGGVGFLLGRRSRAFVSGMPEMISPLIIPRTAKQAGRWISLFSCMRREGEVHRTDGLAAHSHGRRSGELPRSVSRMSRCTIISFFDHAFPIIPDE